MHTYSSLKNKFPFSLFLCTRFYLHYLTTLCSMQKYLCYVLQRLIFKSFVVVKPSFGMTPICEYDPSELKLGMTGFDDHSRMIVNFHNINLDRFYEYSQYLIAIGKGFMVFDLRKYLVKCGTLKCHERPRNTKIPN